MSNHETKGRPSVQEISGDVDVSDLIIGNALHMSMDIKTAASGIEHAVSDHEYKREEYQKYISMLYAQGCKITVHPTYGKKITTFAQYQGRGLVRGEHSCDYGFYESDRRKVNWSFTGQECLPDINNSDNLLLIIRNNKDQSVECAVLEFPRSSSVNFDILAVEVPEQQSV